MLRSLTLPVLYRWSTILINLLPCQSIKRHDTRRKTIAAIALPRKTLETMGSLPERTRLGHGARRLFRRRRRMGLLPARSRAVAGLPLERRRHRGRQRPPSGDLLRDSFVER